MKTYKTALKITLVCLISVLSFTGINAFNYQTIENSGYDTQLSDQTNIQYSNPSQFYITQITTSATELENNPQQWLNTLYYYSITRLKFADLPYNYLIDENGQIYEGRQGGVGANPELSTLSGAITIGYLSNDSTLTTRASQTLFEMVDETSQTWGISKYSTVKLNLEQKEGTLTTVNAEEIDTDFTGSVNTALKSWDGYDSENLTYQAEISGVTYEKEVEIGSKLHVKVSIKNNNDFAWFTDKNPIYISTLSGEESTFAINGVWDSFSKPTHISQDVVKPGGTVDVEFDLQTKITPGDQSLSFNFLKFSDQPFENSSFSVEFTIVKGDNELVQIYSPTYGFANIRENPRYNAKIIDSVDEGAVFIKTDQNDSGWIEVQYDEETKGWVYVKYIKDI